MSSITRNRTRLRSLTNSCVLFFVLSAWASGSFGGVAMPDFSLMDVNPASPTHGQSVSPRNYLGEVSGWYFGHAT